MNLDPQELTDLKKWAADQWSTCNLGDARRTQRAIKIGAAIARLPAASLPEQMVQWSQLKAAYRLLNCEDVTHEKLSQPHWKNTIENARAMDGSVVLFLQDTTELDYTQRPDIKDIGYIGNGKGRGIMVHSSLAVIPTPENPEILGLACQEVWMRPAPVKKKKTCRQRKKENLRTEGDKWAEMVESIGKAPSSTIEPLWVTVGDRESDVFDYIKRSQALGWHCLTRIAQDRVMTTASGIKSNLKTFARTWSSMTNKTMFLRSRDGEPQRIVRLEVAWAPVNIHPPENSPYSKEETISGWCIRCWESGVDDGLEWILFTTVKVDNAEDALQQLEWYSCRWIIEEYHKCMKTGCAMEKRQLETASGLLTLLGFVAIVSVRLLQLRNISRTAKEVPASDLVPKKLLKVLVAHLNLPDDNLTTAEFWKNIARLGGFIGRSGDGLPGWPTLWRGWQKFQDLCCGVELATKIT